MKNTVLSQEEVTMVNGIIEKVNVYINNPKSINPNSENMDNRLQRIHTLLYMSITKDLITSAKSLENILECSPEEFEKIITCDGEFSLEEAEKNLMTNMIMELLTNNNG